jgi:hypothetical protein
MIEKKKKKKKNAPLAWCDLYVIEVIQNYFILPLSSFRNFNSVVESCFTKYKLK